VTLLNALAVRAADVAFRPLAALPEWAALLALGALTAIVILAVVKATSDQTALAAAKRQVQADLFEMRLYNDDLRALLRAQAAVLRHNGTYLRLSILPLLLTAVPLTLAITQLQSWYGYAGLRVNEPVLVTAELDSAAPVASTLDAAGVTVDGAGAFFPTLRQVVWRVVPREPGDHVIRVGIGGATFDKTLHVSDGVARRSPLRPGPGLLAQLIEPSEPPLPAGAPVRAIRVAYPSRDVGVMGLRLHWLVVYLAAAFGFVLALRKPLGVVI
jgi:uncharacterized membrane protein (DUF106 family)